MGTAWMGSAAGQLSMLSMRCHLSFLLSAVQILVARSPRLEDATRTLRAFACLHNVHYILCISCTSCISCISWYRAYHSIVHIIVSCMS